MPQIHIYTNNKTN